MSLLNNRLSQWLAGMIVLVAVLATMAAIGATGPFEEAASAVFGPVQRALRQAAEPVANLVENIDDFDRADDRNRALQNRIEQLEAENTRLLEEQIQVRGHEALIAVQEAQSGEIFVTAEVITRDLTGLRDIIGIDRGSDDGVEEGMPVVAAGGSLVGVVLEVRSNASFVRLITDPDSTIRALHQLSRAEGVVQGGTSDSLAVEFVPKATDVQPGHLFVTSGLGGRLPKGIPIGRTTSAEGSAQDVFKQIRLRPLAPLDELESVLIQITFVRVELPPVGTGSDDDAALPENVTP